MKKIILIIIATVILISAAVGFYYRQGYSGLGIKQCPEAWYDNQMPSVRLSNSDPVDKNTQYLIVNGERRETSEFNMQWIGSHCKINKPAVVE